MRIELVFAGTRYGVDLNQPIDISLPINHGEQNPNCYWAEPVKFETIRSGNFVGSVKDGGSVNYQKLAITPHGNGTHTECYGHISADDATINQSLRSFHFISELISVVPEQVSNGDFVITLESIHHKIKNRNVEALVMRTLPNDDSKRERQYSNTNPPYLDDAVTEFLVSKNIKHLLIDLPSVDREVDEGKLKAHKAFWRFPHAIRKDCTITELIFVNNSVPDGLYLLNIQITSLEMDTSPSKPVLFKLKEVL